MPEEVLRRGEWGGGAKEASVYSSAYTVDSPIAGALLVKGPVDPGSDDIQREEYDRWVVPELEALLVNGRRGGRLSLWVGPVRTVLLERAMVHPP